MPPKTPPTPDPLADLRGDVDGSAALRHSLPDAGGTATTTQEGRPGPVVPDPPAPDVEPALDENAQVMSVVQAWHADLTAQSFGHSGGVCGCAYLARKAVRVLRG